MCYHYCKNRFLKARYEFILECFLSCFRELHFSHFWWFAPRYWFHQKLRPLIILDDIQSLFKNEEMKNLQSMIINSLLYPLRDSNQACIILITSDYTIEKELNGLSGMSSRLRTFPFPEMTKSEFEFYVSENIEILKTKNHLLSSNILMKYYEDFNSDLRSLNSFIEEFQGNYEGN